MGYKFSCPRCDPACLHTLLLWFGTIIIATAYTVSPIHYYTNLSWAQQHKRPLCIVPRSLVFRLEIYFPDAAGSTVSGQKCLYIHNDQNLWKRCGILIKCYVARSTMNAKQITTFFIFYFVHRNKLDRLALWQMWLRGSSPAITHTPDQLLSRLPQTNTMPDTIDRKNEYQQHSQQGFHHRQRPAIVAVPPAAVLGTFVAIAPAFLAQTILSLSFDHL